MEFCDICDNMLYIKHVMKEESMRDESVSNGVEYFCKFCGNVESLAQNEPKLISKVSFQNNQDVEDLVGGDMINDITLPHVHNIPCKNTDCVRPEGEKHDVILMRYDTKNSKYMYYCTYCHTKWK